MNAAILVALGGACGALARYWLGSFVMRGATDWKFPVGTFVVNVLGCLIAGVLAAVAERRHPFPEEMRLLLFVGVLGGFTTFSAFGLETVSLLRRDEVAVAASYVTLSVLCGVGSLWIGLKAAAWGMR